MKYMNKIKSGQYTVSILVPCFNEEKTIEKCLKSWINQSNPVDQIVVVDDGSTDNSLKVLEKCKSEYIRRYKVYKRQRKKVDIKIIPIEHRGSKSKVQEEGLKYINTDIFIATDADTLLDKDFTKNILKRFENPKVDVVTGSIRSLKHNWLTACRDIEYVLSHDIYKTAQSKMNYLFVILGCAGAFRTKVFKKIISFDHDTLTEDLDITYKFTESNTKIYYAKEAIVYTQDPAKIKQYINQVRRWYAGGYQNLIKHFNLVKKPIVAFELSLIYLEGLLFSLLLLLSPFINIYLSLYAISIYLVADIVMGVYASVRRKRADLILYSPLMVVLNYINSYIYIEQFIKEVIFKKRNLEWFHPERREIV